MNDQPPLEREWFQQVMAERPAADLPTNSRGDDASWVVQPGETVAGPIEETARHVGHVDILCELAGGSTGVDG